MMTCWRSSLGSLIVSSYFHLLFLFPLLSSISRFYFVAIPCILQTRPFLHLLPLHPTPKPKPSSPWLSQVRFSLRYFLPRSVSIFSPFFFLSIGISYPICGSHPIFIFYAFSRLFSSPLLLGHSLFFHFVCSLLLCRIFPWFNSVCYASFVSEGGKLAFWF